MVISGHRDSRSLKWLSLDIVTLDMELSNFPTKFLTGVLIVGVSYIDTSLHPTQIQYITLFMNLSPNKSNGSTCLMISSFIWRN
jgi:hypothetical protein